MQYQVEDPAFAQQDFNNMKAEYGGSISSMGSEWGNFALGYAAQFNPDYAAGQLEQLWAADDPVATDVTYAGATYYQTYALRMLGTRQWQFHISVPTSSVYYNTNSGQYTYVAYNPQSTPQIATVYSNNIAIGTLVLPAYTLVNRPALGNAVTNVVPSSVNPGVEISWPTIVNTNYAVQWTAGLATNAAWTNLTTPIVGDGTTNSVFDPFGSYPQKFYRVLRSP